MSSGKRKEKLSRENCGTQQEEAFFDGIQHIQLGRFILLSVRISQQLPRLTFLSFFCFLNRPLKHDCTFR